MDAALLQQIDQESLAFAEGFVEHFLEIQVEFIGGDSKQALDHFKTITTAMTLYRQKIKQQAEKLQQIQQLL